jgi:hypothetical protein
MEKDGCSADVIVNSACRIKLAARAFGSHGNSRFKLIPGAMKT